MRRIFAVTCLLLLPRLLFAVEWVAARHLLDRTGFGVTPQAIARLQPLDYEQAVDRLLGTVRSEPRTPPPGWVNDPPPDFRKLRGMNESERRGLRRARRRQGHELKAWWYREMIDTDSPLTERMTLFWHNHFTSGLRKVKWPVLMYRQNLTLRRHALGDFRVLLHAMARDPAMILYLDNQTNRKGQPNENFARELLELFTLGEGNYTETDIREAARAFTGWMVDRRSGTFRNHPLRHDTGVKTFLGHTGRFNGGDIIRIVLEHSEAPAHITRKLWREFVSPEPDEAEVARLATLFRDSGYSIRALLRALLLSPQFRDPATRGMLVKSPVEFLIGTVRLLRLPVPDGRMLVRAGRYLGQDIFDPPNVKGWPGGNTWISSNSLLARREILQRLLGQPGGRQVMAAPGAREPGHATPDLRRVQPLLASMANKDRLVDLLLPVAPVNTQAQELEPRNRVAALLLDPAYQVK